MIELFEKLKKKDQNEIKLIFNKDAFNFVHEQINDCSTEIEKIFLNIVEFIAESGISQQD